AEQLGVTAAMRGNWRKALSQYQTALGLYESFDAPRDQARLQRRIAEVHMELGNHAEAEAAYLTALNLTQSADTGLDPTSLWLALANIAEIHSRWSDATEYYQKARASSIVGSPEGILRLLLQNGDAALNAQEWEKAAAAYEEALDKANEFQYPAQVGWILNRMGLLAQAQRQSDDALVNFQEAIEILRENNQPLGEAHVLNNIARLKLETSGPAEADLFAQAALAIAQALGSGEESSRSLYARALIALDSQDFDSAERYLKQAIASNPGNRAAQLQFGNTLLATGRIAEAVQQAEAGLGQSPDWELGAQTQLTIASLYQEDTRSFKNNLKRTRALLVAGSERRHISTEFLRAVDWVIGAMEGNPEAAITALNTAKEQPTLPASLDAYHFARTALLALASSPRRFKGKPALVAYFAPPKQRRKRARRSSKNAESPTTFSDVETLDSETLNADGGEMSSAAHVNGEDTVVDNSNRPDASPSAPTNLMPPANSNTPDAASSDESSI
ncbi:MAG TPA: tetratricopeptide repeat protein, partial [Anaerolineae bacterium]|nr:tetratricopeptide repeat protein [Anaerolineae bacterium]